MQSRATLVPRCCMPTAGLQVTNRRAWADPHRLTPGLLALYRRPLSIEGWDLALTEVRSPAED